MNFKQPVLTSINDRQFILEEDYAYEWIYPESGPDAEKNHYRVTAFKGFVTDCASIPRLLWTFAGVLPTGVHSGAAVIHDLLYQWRGQPQPPGGKFEFRQDSEWQEYGRRWKRRDCDRLFLKMMKEGGSVKWKRTVMYYAVLYFGEKAWES